MNFKLAKVMSRFSLTIDVFAGVKTIIHFIRPHVLTLLVLANFAASTLAQKVSTPIPA